MFERGVAVLVVARRLVGPAQDWIRDGLELAEVDHDHMLGPPVGKLEQGEPGHQAITKLDGEEWCQDGNEQQPDIGPAAAARRWRRGRRFALVPVVCLHEHYSCISSALILWRIPGMCPLP